MPFQFNNGRFVALDAAGVPVVGGMLYSYVNQTTTPQATYTTAALSTPNTNPVVLNARGEAQVWLGSNAYSLALKDAVGNTIWTIDGVQDPQAASAAALAAYSSQLASTTGGGSVGFNPSTNYAPNTIGWFVQRSPYVNASWMGVLPNTGSDVTTALQAVLAYAATVKKPVFLPNGTYIVSGLVMSDLRIGLLGESTLGTILTCATGFTGTLIKMLNTTTNGGDTFERIEDLTIQGTYGVGSVGIDQALVSRGSMKNVNVRGFDVGVRKVNTFTDYNENVEVNDCRTCWNLVGSNHNSNHVRCSAIGFGSSFGGAGTGVKITNNGADGLQTAILWSTCDSEFGGVGAGNGTGFSVACTGTVTLQNVYAEKCSGTILQVLDGHVEVLGGQQIISDSGGFLCDVVGGGASINYGDGASIGSDGSSRIFASIIKTGGSGFVTFARSDIWEKLLTSNSGTLPPNLGRTSVSAPFLKPMGRFFAKTDYTATSTQVDSVDSRTFTCTAPGSLGIYQAFTQQPRINANLPLVIPYASNVDVQVTTVGAPGQSGTVTTIGTLPSTGGTSMIAVFPAAKIVSATQAGMEYWKPSWAAGNYLRLDEVWLYDGGAIKNGQLSLG